MDWTQLCREEKRLSVCCDVTARAYSTANYIQSLIGDSRGRNHSRVTE